MRYFRYQNTDKARNNALKAEYKTLMENKERILQRKKRWTDISITVAVALFFSWSVGVIWLLNTIAQPQNRWLEGLMRMGKGVLGFCLLVAGCVVTVVLTGPLRRRAASLHIPSMKQEIFSKVCEPLREYYGLQEPYIVTKCLDATDWKFRGQDVCIFIVGDELRITKDLVRGFLHEKRDPGCYAFDRQEIVLSKQKNGDRLIAELRAEDAVFRLGYRAKGFIEKNFLKQADL